MKREQPHAQSRGDDVGVMQVVCSSSSRAAQHVQLVPTQHIVNRKNLASGINERLLELQDRDLAPEDYDLLLTLDDLIAHPTVNLEVLERLPTHTAMEDDRRDAFGVCIDAYKTGNDIRTLPCDYRFHSQCINQWLVTVSNRCSLDGNDHRESEFLTSFENLNRKSITHFLKQCKYILEWMAIYR